MTCKLNTATSYLSYNEHRMLTILNDSEKFQVDKTEEDATTSFKNKVNKRLKELLIKKLIDSKTYNELKSNGGRLQFMYGLPKIHKVNVPLRPILSMKNSPWYKLARWLADSLEPIRQKFSNHNLDDTFHFSKEVDHVDISNKLMVSHNVTALFTNVPVMETIDIICKQTDLLPLPESEMK
ncbi:unnamed protein product [Trichobilharzia regenti]|nr:unnamed protein product [Trichobilharzia regenti]